MSFTLRYDEMRVFRVKVKNWTLFEVSKKNPKVPLRAKINSGLHFVTEFTVAHAVQTQR